MRKVILGKQKSVGYGFVGKWRDGTLGYLLPCSMNYGSCKPHLTDWNKNEPVFLCKITLKLIKDKKGRPIVRYLEE